MYILYIIIRLEKAHWLLVSCIVIFYPLPTTIKVRYDNIYLNNFKMIDNRISKY